MKVILVHNQYRNPGGEDNVFAAESDLLEHHGHEVLQYTVHNDSVDSLGKFALARKTVWNHSRYQELRKLFLESKPNIVHVHNTFPLISPAIYYAAQVSRTPICQTLHNYRPLCSNAIFFRNDKVCEDCMGALLNWSSVRHGCYRESIPATMVVSLMKSFHQLIGTWKKQIDVYIALSKFSKQKYIEAGFPKEKIVIKPNFVENSSALISSNFCQNRNGALFVGRLTQEKGINTLLRAWERVGNCMPLRIVGDGPLSSIFKKTASNMYRVSWLGRRTIKEVYELMAKSEILIFPSECYETFGRVAIEAFSHSTPVIASSIGACAEIVDHGRTGLHFEAGNARDLAERVAWVKDHPEEIKRMGRYARTEFETKYTPIRNYTMLMDIYEQTIENHANKTKQDLEILTPIDLAQNYK